jgi:hypothetical protein
MWLPRIGCAAEAALGMSFQQREQSCVILRALAVWEV